MSSLYFLHAPSVNLIKIGRSADPERRFAELRLLSPVPLVVLGTVEGGLKVEANLHRHFDHLVSHGEWFHATKELRFYVWTHCLLDCWEAGKAEWRERARDHFFPDTPIMDARHG